jgi:hypothetical protein
MSADALAWAEFVATLVNAAMSVAKGYDDLSKVLINVGGLKEFLKNGLVGGVGDESLLAKITGKAKDSAETDGNDPGKVDEEKEETFEEKKKEDDRGWVFIKKMEEDERARCFGGPHWDRFSQNPIIVRSGLVGI